MMLQNAPKTAAGTLWMGVVAVWLGFGFGMMGCDAAPADAFTVVRDGGGVASIVVSDDADERTREAARDLSTQLARISGVTFPVRTSAGPRAIYLGTNEAFDALPFRDRFENGPFTQDAYHLYTTADALYIVGDTSIGVQNGVWDFLYSLGYRQYFPGPNWEIVPRHSTIQVTLDRYEAPDYIVRDFWYNWGAVDRDALNDWLKKNRMGKSFVLQNGHTYFRIRQWAKAEFDEHPEYNALVDGKRYSNKFCVSNPGLRDVCVRYAIDYFAKHPDADCISMEPDDGGGACECARCGEIGSPSDRVLLLANEVARAVNGAGMGRKYVGILAYNFHCAPPERVNPDPHVIVSCADGYTRGGWTFDRVCAGWREKGATMGTYLYYNVVARDWCKPGKNKPAMNASTLRRCFEDYGIRFATIEAGESWGPYGLGFYVSSRALWDTSIGSPHPWDDPRADDTRVMSIIDEFLRNCFGPACGPMAAFLDAMTVKIFHYSPMMLFYLECLAAARDKARGHPEVIARVDDLIKYMHYLTLLEHGSRDELLRWTFRIRNTKMVHALGIFSRKLQTTYSFKGLEGPLYDQTDIRDDELLAILKKDIARYEEQERNAVHPVEKTFSRALVPVREHLEGSGAQATGTLPVSGPDSGLKRILVYVASQPAVLRYRAAVTTAESQEDLAFLLRKGDPGGDVVARKTLPRGAAGKGDVLDLALAAPSPGLYCLEATMGNGRIEFTFPKGQSFVLGVAPFMGEYLYAQHYMFHGTWNMYFYVPKGTTVVSLRGSKIWSFMPPISGKLLDGSGNERADFATIAQGGNLNVEVPEGEDGTFWKFADSTGLRHLFNVPPYISAHPDDLLLPAEVVERDFR